MAADRILREHPGHDASQRFPPFRFIGNRNQVGHTMNPYLIILAAEIEFRRCLAANGTPLFPIYDSLMRKTIQVAELLYFVPADRVSAFRDPVVIDMEASHNPVNFLDAEMGFRTGAAAAAGVCGYTARQQRQSASGGVVEQDV